MYSLKKKNKIIVTMLCVFVFVTLFSVTAFADGATVTYDGNDLDTSMSAILQSEAVVIIKSIIVSLVNPVSSVALGASFIGLMLSSSQKQAENFLKSIKAIVWGFALLNSMGVLLSAIGSIVGNHQYTF